MVSREKKTISKKFKNVVIAIVVVFTIWSGITLLQAKSSRSWTKVLPFARRQTDLVSGTATNKDDAAKISLDFMGENYDSMWVIIRARDKNGKWHDVTGHNNIVYLNNPIYLSLNSDVYRGQTLMLVGGNNNWTHVNVSSKGRVTFP